MFYDSTKMTGVSEVERIVQKTREANGSAVSSKNLRQNVFDLVKYMSIETCERFLSSMGTLPYIPWKTYNGLTCNQMVALFDNTYRRIWPLAIKLRDDHIHLGLKSLASIAIKQEERKGDDGRAIAPILTFSNGTRFTEVAHHYNVFNARAILYVALNLYCYSAKCRELLNLVCDSICKTDEWLVFEDPKGTVEGFDSGNDPTTNEDASETPQEPATPIVALSLIDSSSEATTASERLPEPPESIFSKFLATLPPGTELVIRIPSVRASA